MATAYSSTAYRTVKPVDRLRRNVDTGLREPGNHRVALHEGAIGLVEDSAVSPYVPPPSGYETRYQVAFPYLGLFGYRVGRQIQYFDANRMLFVRPGIDFRDEHPVPDVGHAAVLITPDRAILDELCGAGGARAHSAFRDGARPSSPRIHVIASRMLQIANRSDGPLMRDELTIAALRAALAVEQASAAPSQVVDRAKQVIHARGCEPITLQDVANDVGVSGVYLTQQFSRVEGVPLYRYQLKLRLSRALLELPYCEDITGLALDLGFSSHSHFTAAFRKAFGVTPSHYRAALADRRHVARLAACA